MKRTMNSMTVMIVVLSLGSFAMPTPEANAHAAGTKGSIHYSSFDCRDEFKGTAQPVDGEADYGFRCTIEGQFLQILCQNPNGQNVVPGEAATQIAVSGDTQFEGADINNKKVKGRSAQNVIISDEPFLLAEYCVNPNWIPIQVLVIDFNATLEVYELDTGTRTWVQVLECTAPEGTSVVNLPAPGTPFDCDEVFSSHEW